MKIKEVETMLQLNAQTIRYYEKLGFLNPKRDLNGYRNYSEEDIKVLKKIRFLRELDMSLEMIERILAHEDEFQDVLEIHLKTLQLKVIKLEEIQKRCLDLNRKNIPLLDGVVEGEFQEVDKIHRDGIKELTKKISNYLKPSSVITLGRKTTSYQLLKQLCGCYLGLSFVFLALLHFSLRMNIIHHVNWLLWFVVDFILVALLIIMMFDERFVEFRNNDFVVFESKGKKLKSIKAILMNTTDQLAKKYSYQQIDSVVIRVEEKLGGLGFGVGKYHNIIYQFKMKDASLFEINSSMFLKSDQDRRAVYEILEYHDVKIIDHQNLKEYLE